MLCDRVLGNVGSDDAGRFAGRPTDVLELTWRDCLRRAVRGRTNGGLPIGILLPRRTRLRHGDVLADDAVAGTLVVVDVQPCEVWVADFADSTTLATAALELGNLHVPVEVAAPQSLVTLPDGPVRAVFDRLARSWRSEVRRFEPLKATVLPSDVRLAAGFATVRRPPAAVADAPQLTNSRE
jgi:urease accessory protein UreE